MRRRWTVYVIVGILFGAFDFIYLGLLYQIPWGDIFGNSPAERATQRIVRFLLNLGVWLVPVIPITVYETRISRSRLRSAAASVAVWCSAIVAYYLTNAVQLAFWGLPTRPEMHISNLNSPYFWHNWRNVFLGDILGGITVWIMVAFIGGAIIGSLTGSIYLQFHRRPQAREEI